MKIISASNHKEIEKVMKRGNDLDSAVEKVKPVLEDVRKDRDKALFKYIEKFDGKRPAILLVAKKELKEAFERVDTAVIRAIKQSKENVERYAKLQMPKGWTKEVSKGVVVGQLVRPLDSVGCYVPGGNFPLISTVVMTVVPAKVAGVKEVVVCTPKDNDDIYAACYLCGVDKVYRIGGAQAIAAMAYGTESVQKVEKIVGPGNIYVTAAKKLVNGDVGIDFLAGPSEVMIIAEKGNAKFIAADMLAQAEHDMMASAVLVTTDKKLAQEVNEQIDIQLKELDSEIAKKSIENYGMIIIVKNIEEAISLANEFAPEHLEIIVKDKERVIPELQNFGALFIGEYSPEAAGDYCSGPNHVLPTGGVARYRSGLSVLDFLKMPTVQELSREGLVSLRKSITKLAALEGLRGHKVSVEIRD
ncbi:MAG TPA: histidinol dehydrogenase [Candidatus Nanoarchaeia archaeon]|nr:histidinol dehydrogenase [Candidatus Nanoarchaeia archaeon]